MPRALLTIDLGAIAANWRALDRLSGTAETAAVVKADAYGLGVDRVAPALARAGARTFFVAQAAEGVRLRAILGPGPVIAVFEGHLAGEADAIRAADLTPMINAPDQWARQRDALPGRAFGVQLDTGMSRLGLAPGDWADLRGAMLAAGPALVISHLACADEPDHPMNGAQLARFVSLTEGVTAPRSLSATGGTLLGPGHAFDLVRPGIGLYGGLPFARAAPVVRLSAPVIQTRRIAAGETVGYGASWRAGRPSLIATVSSGYADGLIRAMGGRAMLHAVDVPCPVVGRVSMDLLTIDVTDAPLVPSSLDLLGEKQSVDDLAAAAGTIGYEVLTSLGARYERRFLPGQTADAPRTT